jgi:hypothetical protein
MKAVKFRHISGVTRKKCKSKVLDFLVTRRNSESRQRKLEVYLHALLTLALDGGQSVVSFTP